MNFMAHPPIFNRFLGNRPTILQMMEDLCHVKNKRAADLLAELVMEAHIKKFPDLHAAQNTVDAKRKIHHHSRPRGLQLKD